MSGHLSGDSNREVARLSKRASVCQRACEGPGRAPKLRTPSGGCAAESC